MLCGANSASNSFAVLLMLQDSIFIYGPRTPYETPSAAEKGGRNRDDPLAPRFLNHIAKTQNQHWHKINTTFGDIYIL